MLSWPFGSGDLKGKVKLCASNGEASSPYGEFIVTVIHFLFVCALIIVVQNTANIILFMSCYLDKLVSLNNNNWPWEKD